MPQGSRSSTQTLDVRGMSCENCAGHVRRALLSLPGVASAEVSLADNRALVGYDPSLVDAPRMIAAIEDEGYEASPSS